MLDALAIAIGIMNIIETMLTAIWWPATGIAPMREMKSAMKVKPVTSTITASPIGTPRRSSAFRLAALGGAIVMPRPRPKRR